MDALLSVLDNFANETIRPIEGFIVMFGLPWFLLLTLCVCYAYASFARR